jgi:hypothetical protein
MTIPSHGCVSELLPPVVAKGRSFSRRFGGLGVKALAADSESTYVVHALDCVVLNLRANLAPQNTTRCLRWARICGAFERWYRIGYLHRTLFASSVPWYSSAARIHSTSGKPQPTYCLLCVYFSYAACGCHLPTENHPIACDRCNRV